jgi:hypothetical protein
MPLMAEGKILPYLDIPFQHSSPNVLKAMRRPANIDKTAGPHRQMAPRGAGPCAPLDLHRRLPGRDGRRLPAPARLDEGGAKIERAAASSTRT